MGNVCSVGALRMMGEIHYDYATCRLIGFHLCNGHARNTYIRRYIRRSNWGFDILCVIDGKLFDANVCRLQRDHNISHIETIQLFIFLINLDCG